MKNSYRKWGSDLKKLGLIDYDLRKELSTGQKSRITKLRKEWGHYIRSPESFSAQRVGPRNADKLRDAGFKVTPRGRAVIPLNGYPQARYDAKEETVLHGSGAPNMPWEKTYLVDHRKWFQQLRSLMAEPLPRNQMVTVRIGDRNAFSRSRFHSYAELYYYLENEFEPNDEGESKASLLALMSVVYVPAKDTKKSGKKKAAPKKTKEGYKIDPVTGEISMPKRKSPNAKKKAAAKKKRGN